MDQFDADIQSALGGDLVIPDDPEVQVPTDEETPYCPITLPSGGQFQVHPEEFDYVTQRVQSYNSQIHFENISDLQDLDRVIIYELLIWRWTGWMISGVNYVNDVVDEPTLHKQIKETGGELRQLKGALNMDKVSRDRQRGEDSVAAFLAGLSVRAEHFGYKRRMETGLIMETFMTLRAKITLHDNCTEHERREQHCTMDDIINWLREEAFPIYDEIDRKFRQETPPKLKDYTEAELRYLAGGQSMWIREQ